MALLNRHFVASLLLLAAMAAYQLSSSSVIAINGGYGFDGALYGSIAQNFSWDAVYGRVDSYRAQRILPSLIVGTALNALGRHEVSDTIAGFRALTVALLGLSALGWYRICRRMCVTVKAFWIGFLLLFVNFFVMNNAFYYPVLTDVAAFALGMWMIYAYLVNSVLGIAIVGIAGAFAWPVCAPVSVILVLFPLKCEQQTAPSRGGTRFSVVLAIAAASFIVAAGIAVRFILGRVTVGYGPVNAMDDTLLPASAFIHLTLLAMALFFLIKQITITQVLVALRSVGLLRWVMAAAIFLLPKIVILLFASDAKPTLPMTTFAAMLAFLPLVRPAISPVSHFAYFGFVIPLLAINWRRIGNLAGNCGTGTVAFITLSLLFALTPESRQSVLTLPALVTMLCQVIDRDRWTGTQIAALGALQLLLARFWIDQNARFEPDGVGINVLPTYFSSQGPYMPMQPYGVFLLLLITATVLCILQRQSSRCGRLTA